MIEYEIHLLISWMIEWLIHVLIHWLLHRGLTPYVCKHCTFKSAVNWALYSSDSLIDCFYNWLIVVQRIDTVRVQAVYVQISWQLGPLCDWLIDWDIKWFSMKIHLLISWMIVIQIWLIHILINWLLYRGLTPYVCKHCTFKSAVNWALYVID